MKLVPLSPRVYVLQGEVEPEVRENAGFVVSAKGVVVIDTTRTLADGLWAYRQITTVTDKSIAYVINTHGHIDHVFGNQLFDAPIIAHRKNGEAMRAMLAKEWSPEGLAKIIQEWARPEEMEGIRIVLPQILFSEALTLDMGDLTVEVTHVGGHSPGSSIVYVPEEETVFLADLLCVGRYPVLMWANQYGNIDEWLAALDYVKKLKVRTFVPGHGPVSTLQEVLKMEGYFRDLKERIIALAKQGLSKEEIVAHPSFPKYAERTYARLHPTNIGLAYDQIFPDRKR